MPRDAPPPGLVALAGTIRSLREQHQPHRLTQKQLVEITGLGWSTIKGIESFQNRRRPRDATLERLRTAFGLEPGYLEAIIDRPVEAIVNQPIAPGGSEEPILGMLRDMLVEFRGNLDGMKALLERQRDILWRMNSHLGGHIDLEGYQHRGNTPELQNGSDD